MEADPSVRSTEIEVVKEQPVTAILNPHNGHYYELWKEEQVTWEEAKKLAAQRTFRGMQGYLATITSEQENRFLVLQWGDEWWTDGWIGASDAEEEGVWKWVTGPEAGEVFWRGDGTGVESGYSNWAKGSNREPNNQRGNENYAIWNWTPGEDAVGRWNDAAADWKARGVLIEYSADKSRASRTPR